MLFTVLRFTAQTVFNQCDIKYKINYDYVDQVVRVTWHLTIFSNFIINSPLIVDGISNYHINCEGNVFKHEVTNIIANGIE
jgi:hypothetical protein